ncbi:MAG: diguanylate cyclase [Arcobacteraceae bacterium]
MMPTVSDICTKKIISIEITASIADAVHLMTEKNVRSILITEDKTNNYFIFTTSDAIEYKIKNLPLNTKLLDLKLQKVEVLDANISILEVTNTDQLNNEYFIVLDNKNVVGILSQTDIINNIDPQMLIQKKSISSIMLQYTVQTIYQNEATINAIRIMKDKDIDSVIVINDDAQPLGIFTTKDFLNIVSETVDLALPIKTYMSFPLETVSKDVKIFEALEFIRIKGFKRLIITDDEGKISGVITQKELLRLINNKWMELIRERGLKLSKINDELIKKSSLLEETASQDFLTTLYNRRKFDALLQYEIEQIKRYNRGKLSILIIDIDNFKIVNDTYGHDIGDAILKEIAMILKKLSRSSDVASRWGGEEFAVTLTQTAIEDALFVAEKLRGSIQDHIFTKDLKITCSFGISQFRTTDEAVDLFKRADEALYEAKNTGKNKVALERL